MSPDPYAGSYRWKNPQSLNRYAYVLNNPLSFTDPDGLYAGVDCGGGGWDSTGDASNGQPCGNYGGRDTTYPGSASGGATTTRGGYTYCYKQDAYVNGTYDSSDTFCDSYGNDGLSQNTSANNVTAPSSGPILSPKQIACAKEAFGKNAVSLGLDALGALGPAGGAAGLIFQTAVGVTSVANSAISADTSKTGIIGLSSTFAGLHVTALTPAARISLRTEAGFAKSFANLLPGIGTALNVISAGADIISTGKDYNACMAR